MSSPFHFAFGRRLPRFRWVCACGVLGFFALVFSSPSHADEQTPADSIGGVVGADVSVNGQMLASPSTTTPVSSGNDVTVHSGQALLKLAGGGDVSICGPAKFTALESNGQVTLALEFGRMHVELPAGASLRVLTPSIVATPIEIQGGKRDLTVGLDQNNLLCVIASRGAVKLEQEFSGEQLMVPESGDFSLAAGQLVPVSGEGAVCHCDAYPDAAPSSTPRYPAPEVTVLAPQPSDAAPPLAVPPAPKPPAPKTEDAPKVSEIILPPLAFSSPTTVPPEVPTEATVALLRELHAEPDWSFTGRVETPEFAKAMSKALGVKPPTTSDPPAAGAALPQQLKKKRGFWGTLKTIFVGDKPH